MLVKYHDARHGVRDDVLRVLEGLSRANEEGFEALKAMDADKLRVVRKTLKNFDKETERIDNDIVLIFAKYTPEARDLREMVSYLKITSSLKRIRTNLNNYLKNMQSMISEDHKDIIQMIQDSLHINHCTMYAFDQAIQMHQIFDNNDKIQALASKIEVEYSKTDDIYSLLEKEVSQKIYSSDGFAEEYFNLLKYIRKHLKIIDRLDSIAQRVIFARMGGKL